VAPQNALQLEKSLIGCQLARLLAAVACSYLQLWSLPACKFRLGMINKSTYLLQAVVSYNFGWFSLNSNVAWLRALHDQKNNLTQFDHYTYVLSGLCQAAGSLCAPEAAQIHACFWGSMQ